MKIRSVVLAAAALATLATQAVAGSFDVGARYGRSVEENGTTVEVAARYFPLPIVSLGATLGYTGLSYDKGWYHKKAYTMPLGGYVNAHLPLVPFVKPYAGIGGVYYGVNNVTSSNPLDRKEEHSGTMTVQGGVDISLPVPFLSLNVEARRLINDRQTLVLGGVWFSF